MCMWMYVYHMHTGCLEWQAIVSYPMEMLGTQHKSFARSANALYTEPSLQALKTLFFPPKNKVKYNKALQVSVLEYDSRASG